jgi:hypothetical protein
MLLYRLIATIYSESLILDRTSSNIIMRFIIYTVDKNMIFDERIQKQTSIS